MDCSVRHSNSESRRSGVRRATRAILATLSLALALPAAASAAPEVRSISPTQGPDSGGTTVTISGGGLSGATAVMFGSQAANSFKVNVDGTGATAVAPPGSGTVDVTVTVAGETSATSEADRFTYVPPTPYSFASTAGAFREETKEGIPYSFFSLQGTAPCASNCAGHPAQGTFTLSFSGRQYPGDPCRVERPKGMLSVQFEGGTSALAKVAGRYLNKESISFKGAVSKTSTAFARYKVSAKLNFIPVDPCHSSYGGPVQFTVPPNPI